MASPSPGPDLARAVIEKPPRPAFQLDGHTDAVWCVAFSRDGHSVLSAGMDRTVRVWDLATRAERLVRTDHAAGVTAVVALPGSDTVVSAGLEGAVCVWDEKTGQVRDWLRPDAGRLFGLAAAPDGRSVALAAESGEVLLWDFEGPPRRFRGHTAPVTAVAFDPNGREVRSVSEDGTSRLWDVRTGQELRRFWPDQQEPLKCAALSADGSTALTAGVSGRVDWWRLSDGRLLGSFPAGTDWVRCVTFLSDADGNEVGFVAGGDDETLRVVPFAAGAEPRLIPQAHDDSILCLARGSDGRFLVTGGADQVIRVWNLADLLPRSVPS